MLITSLLKKKSSNNILYYNEKKNFINKIILLKYCKQKFYQKKNTKNFKKVVSYLKNILMLKKQNTFFYSSSSIRKLNKKLNITNSNLISYILNVTLSPSNIILSVTDLKGVPQATCSSGIVNFKGSQKTKRLALNSVLKKIKYKTKKLKNQTFVIHFQGIKRNRNLLLNKIKTIFIIKNIKYFNLIAHNGCKPKKN